MKSKNTATIVEHSIQFFSTKLKEPLTYVDTY